MDDITEIREYVEAEKERSYETGRRRTLTSMLRHIMRELGDLETDEMRDLGARIEREEAMAVLRRVCGNHGDNDWSENLHLGDVIEKHLERHLDRRGR